jgi:hypothetical protein
MCGVVYESVSLLGRGGKNVREKGNKFTYFPRQLKFFGLKKEVFGLSRPHWCGSFREIYLDGDIRQIMLSTNTVE